MSAIAMADYGEERDRVIGEILLAILSQIYHLPF
jgi:hypothetical protein